MCKTMWHGRAEAALATLVVSLWSTGAQALWEDEDGHLVADGSLRGTALATQNYDDALLFGSNNPSDGQSDTFVRLTIEGDISDAAAYELHAVQRLALSTGGGAGGTGGLFGSPSAKVAYRMWQGRLIWGEPRGDVDARLWLDRAAVRVTVNEIDITLGRQAVSFGKAYFWNPLDVFLPFGATQVDRDYKAGVDAARVDVPFGDFSGATFVFASGEVPGGSGGVTDGSDSWWRGSAAFGRVFTNVSDWDLAAQGGKVSGGYLFGGGVSGEVSTLGVRGELTWFQPDSDPLRSPTGDVELEGHLTAVVGLGRRFESSLNIEIEHLYNGGSAQTLQESAVLLGAGRLLMLSRNVTGAVISYELHPLVQGSFAAMVEWDDGSWLLQPGIIYSAASEVDVIAGAMIAGGSRPTGASLPDLRLASEFGTYPNAYYVQTKIYF